jgi:hypothetical protein
VSETIHTTASAAEYLQRRYDITVQARTVKQWCNRGKLRRAYRIGEGRRATWQIPQSDLDALAEKKVKYNVTDKTTDTKQKSDDL